MPELQRLTAVRVVVAELNVRAKPTTSSTVRATVDAWTIFVLGGYEPVFADGYTWWNALEVVNAPGGKLPALPTQLETYGYAGAEDAATGYIAAAGSATSYVEALPVRCPATVDLEHISAMLAGERASCFESRAVTITGTLHCGPCEEQGPPQTFEPRWLADESLLYLENLRLHLPPGLAPAGVGAFLDNLGNEVRLGSIVRVAGHFNDPSSATCRIELYVDDDTSDSVEGRYAEQACRQSFVVDSFEVLGTDPDYIAPF